MKQKKIISILALIMAIIMILSLVVSVLPAAFAVDESDIEQLQKEKEELTNRVGEAKERIDDLKEQQSSVLEQQAALNEEVRAAEEAIAVVERQLAIYDKQIAEKARELEAARKIEESQLKRYRMRVRAMEEGGGFSILALLVDAGSLSEFLAAMDDVAEIMASDKALERQYRSAREESERVMGEFEELRSACQEKQKALVEEKEEIVKQVKEAEELSAALEDELADALEEYKAVRDAEAAAAWAVLDIIAQYDAQKKQEEEARRAAESQVPDMPQESNTPAPTTEGAGTEPAPQPTDTPASQPEETGNEATAPNPTEETGGENIGEAGNETGSETGGETEDPVPAQTPAPTPAPTPEPTPALPEGATGSFIWPVPCSMRITSRFGNRIDPFTGETRYHSGIDIDGYKKEGYSIIAADGGTVVTSSYNSGYGNYVIIDHGNGYKTLYAHMSGSAVSTGSTVTQGQTIGYLGATGRATGTHCHFEVFKDGSRIDPEQFFSGMTYWNC